MTLEKRSITRPTPPFVSERKCVLKVRGQLVVLILLLVLVKEKNEGVENKKDMTLNDHYLRLIGKWEHVCAEIWDPKNFRPEHTK